MEDSDQCIDPKSGFSATTSVFHSLRPHIPLPPPTTPLSISDCIFSLLKSPPQPLLTAALIDATTNLRVPFHDLIRRVETLSSSLQTITGLCKGHTALIVSPNSLHVPILYLSLLSLGIIVTPSNPASSELELIRHIHLCKPVIAFVTSQTARKIPSLPFGTILLDSTDFETMMTNPVADLHRATINQSDTAAILLSSGTSGRVKGVELTHWNWISVLTISCAALRDAHVATFCTVPFFHVYGFALCLRSVAMGHTMVLMERFDMKVMIRSIQEFSVTHVALAPPTIMALVSDGNATNGYDLSSLQVVASGGAALRKCVIQRFRDRFPNVQLVQTYGLTETTGRAFGTVGPEESRVVGATGRLAPNLQAKIVDTETGMGLPPNKTGELWIRGPIVMKGYIGDEEATIRSIDSERWFKTGDLCYIDSRGFLFFVDRLKELIKYKAYQVPPAELEHLLQSHPDVVEAAVAPYPDEEAGQIPMAFVVRRNGSVIDDVEIKDFIAKQVAPYKRIRRVMFVDSIPKNAPGKVLRRELIKLASSNPTSKL